MPLRRLLGLSAAIAGRHRRGLSAAASRPPWAMICKTEELARSPALRASFQLAAPPCVSHLFVPAHFVDPSSRPDREGDVMPLVGGGVRAASEDGLLLLDFMDGSATAPIVHRHGTFQARRVRGFNMDPDITRFVANPLSGQLVRLPDIDGTKKTVSGKFLGILSQSDLPDGPPDRYAVAWLDVDGNGEERSLVMRRFLSQTGEWDKMVGLPSPIPLGRRMCVDHEVVAFAGRLWWFDVSWGAVAVDPFSDRPELRFVELPRGSVTEPVEGLRVLGRYRRLGVSEGRLRYAEVSQKKPFVLSCGWTLEHRVALGPLLEDGDQDGENTPCIGVIDPLNSSMMYLTMGDQAVAVDMDMGKVLGSSLMWGRGGGPVPPFTGFLQPCVLPPWLGTCQIPSAGKKRSGKGKSLAEFLVRPGCGYK